MRYEAIKYDRVKYESETGFALGRVEKTVELAMKYTTDPDKKARLEKQECVVCFYGGRIGGTTSSERPCAFCQTRVLSGSTNVGIACTDCAKKHGICKHCGADVYLKFRRKLSF